MRDFALLLLASTEIAMTASAGFPDGYVVDVNRLKHESDPKIYFNGRWDDAPGTWWSVYTPRTPDPTQHYLSLNSKGGFWIKTRRPQHSVAGT